jgi:hypothetical protein
MHDRAAEGCRREVSLACPVPSRLSAAASSKHRLEAARLALPQRPLTGLAQVQEPRLHQSVRREAEEDWGRAGR